MRHLPMMVAGISAARAAFAATALLASAFLAQAQEAEPLRGVAMVIGNSEYEHLPALANPANDARAVEMLLSALGFETELSSDRDARRLARDLDIFVEDAEGADVAILYYAGHGIEAGGQNFLVPVDADMSALDAAGEKLVPISSFIEQLQATVPVVIVMLDACRDNPFPAGSTVRLDASAEPMPMGEGGLSETRGAARIAPAGGSPAENYGTVIAFAAEPGHAALDGEPGGNSPYTAAVLRHLETMAGEEFGLVMRMVAEEVYLKTAGRQRPWINESLRRLLYFGETPQTVSGAEGDILTERRQLLVTISALPMQGRTLVEKVAGDRGVPMDALFAMLDTLGEDLPDDPAELDRLLRRLADDLKRVLEERSALRSTDPEISRLAELAETATAEGALSTAVSLYEQAKARIGELEETVASAEDSIRDRRVEFAEIYARSAEARALALDHKGAATDFAEAADQVKRWDDGLALEYKLAQARALIDHGVFRGDTPALTEAVSVLDGLIGDADGALATQARTSLADALAELGRRQTTNETLERAIAAYRSLIGDGETDDRAQIMRRLGAALLSLGRRDIGAARLEEAVAALESALDLMPRADAPQDWAATQVDLGEVRIELWERDRESDALELAIAHYRAALEIFERQTTPALWASAQLGLGNALRFAGLKRMGGSLPGHYFGWLADTATDDTRAARDLLALSDAAFAAALEVCERETYPVCWAATQHGRAVALYSLGSVELDDQEAAFGHFRRSMEAFENALSEQRFEMSPLGWAEAYASRAEMLERFGMRSAAGITLIYLAEAARGYREALSVIGRESLPAMWVDINNRLASVYNEMIQRDARAGQDVRHAEQEVESLRAALSAIDPLQEPEAWAAQRVKIFYSLLRLVRFTQAKETMVEALAIRDDLDHVGTAFVERSVAGTLLELAAATDTPEFVRAARRSIENAWSVDYRTVSSRQKFAEVEAWYVRLDEALAAFDTERLREAAERYESVVAGEARQESPQEWARGQYDLAALLRVIGERESDGALLERSLAAYRAALAVWTQQTEPLRHGLVQEQLGDMLRLMAGQKDDLVRYQEATQAYEAGLAGLSRTEAAFDHARLHRKLADTLNFSIGRPQDDRAALHEAVAHYREALDIETAQVSPGWYIGLQNAMADVLVELTRRGEGSVHAAEAVRSYGSALAPQLIELYPDIRAEGEAKLAAAMVVHADALTNEGEAAGDMARVREAQAHYESALQIHARLENRVDEAYARANYAGALYILGEAERDVAMLERVVVLLREGMAALDRQEHSGYWAWAHDKIGMALNRLSEIDRRPAAEAVAAFRAVQDLRPRETDAWGWAAATHNVAYSLILDARAGNDVDFDEVLALSRSTEAVFAEHDSAYAIALAGSVQCMGLTGLARARDDAGPAREAIETCERAIPVIMDEGSELAKQHVRQALDEARAAAAELEREGTADARE